MITLREYEPGEVVLRQHDDGDAAYTIVTGKVRVSREVGGETLDLGFLGPGETFGEMGMIDDRPRSATVTATEATTLREIHREAFLDSLQTHPDVAMNLLRAIFERLRQAHTTIAQLQSRNDSPKIRGTTTARRASATPLHPGLPNLAGRNHSPSRRISPPKSS